MEMVALSRRLALDVVCSKAVVQVSLMAILAGGGMNYG
jgi:hypothetical protein